MSRQTQSYDDKAIRGEELESLATSIAQKIVDNGQVVADALDELDARTRALENRNPDVLGDAVADSLDTQVLKIGGQPIDTSAFEKVSNKMSAWQTTPDNTHYPSEKLVKDGLDAKADADNAVTIYDSYVCRINTRGNYWYKIAEVPFKNGLQFRNAVWDVYANVNNSSGVYKGTLVMKTNSSASSVEFKYARLYTDDWDSNVFDFKIVVKTTFSNGYVQLWAKLNSSISSLSISERFMFAGTYKPSKKSPFTYTSYDSVAGEVEPQTDATNNITANPVNIVYRQHAIASPTNDNLVAMDANGLVKDSGLAKSSVESAISSAGSAIQGVKVNNTTLTPDANKVVTVPLATTSADGAMSSADKAKLDNAATSNASSGTAPVKVDAYGALTPVPMDSTPTASSTNLVTSGGVKTALDGKQDSLPTSGTASDTYAINISGFSNRMRGATVAGATNGTGYYKLAKFKFDNFPRTYEGALLSIITRSGNQSIEGLISVSFSEWTTADESGDIIGNVAILGMRGTELPASMYDMYFIKTASKEYYLYAHIKKTSVIVTVNILNVDAGVNPADVLLVPEYVGSELPTNLKNLKLPYRKMVYGTVENGAVGSSSIPVYIDANGKATACTDDFARDSEVVTNVEYVAAQSGGGGNLNKTKNGSTTSVLAFMTTAEATSLWQSAWAAAN